MNEYIKDELWKVEVTNNALKDLVIEKVDNGMLRCVLIQNLNLQSRIINNVKEVLDNERNNNSK